MEVCKLMGTQYPALIENLELRSQSRNDRIARMNTWLERWGKREGFKFLGQWNRFWGRWDLYKSDDLHLGRTGTNVRGGGRGGWGERGGVVFASAVGEG